LMKESVMKKKNFAPGPVLLDVAAGQLNAQDRIRIKHPKTGGVILFGRNYESREQLTSLTQEIKAIRPDVLITIDHEGGRVQRCKTDGFTHLPAMRRLGDIWNGRHLPVGRNTPEQMALLAIRAATAVGYVLAAELRACGVDFSFTPVLDLDYAHSQVIGDRAFHAEASVVTLLAKGLCHGLLLAGMRNCGKHFPGHGYASADSHTHVPTDDRPLEMILQHDAKPYEDFGMILDAVMPAHVVYQKVDSLPAGFSKKWLQEILRQRLGFQGVIFSDDLSMEGASVMGDVVAGAKAALGAGCDAVLICNRPDLADLLLDQLPINKTSMVVSRERLVGLFPRGPTLDWKSLQNALQYQRAKMFLQSLGLIATLSTEGS
jgi:beta-N-acetylhexosaminidase